MLFCQKMKVPCLSLLFVSMLWYTNGQFSQNTYDIEHDRLFISDFNKTAVLDPQLYVFKYNDTLRMKAINGSAYFTPGVKKKILINVAVFRFVAKAYRPFPINITLDICEEYGKNTFGIQAAIKNSNFKGCPCPVGLYYMYNFVLEQDKFPPHIPFGKYKLVVTVHIDNMLYLAKGEWYGSVSPKQRS